MKNIFLTLIFCFTIFGNAKAEPHNELSIKAGITFPQSTFLKYSSDGFYGQARIISHLNSFKALSGFADLSGSFFSSTEEEVLFTDDIRENYAIRRTSEYSISLHVGTLVGSDSRNSFFRPKIGIAGGLYLFNAQTQILDDLFDEEILAEDNKTQLKVGWRGVIGTDLFFTPKWGLTFEFTHDHVLNLHHAIKLFPGGKIARVGQTARFNNYTIGVIFPLPID